MRIVLCVSNSYIENKIKEKYSMQNEVIIMQNIDEVCGIIQDRKESVIIFKCSFNEEKCISYITKIKEINNENRVILIVKELSKEFKEKLFSKEVFNIIVGESFELNEIMQSIDSPKLVIYKNVKEVKNNSVFFVCGLKKSGKSLVCKIISNELRKYKDKKVIVVDLDNVSPVLDLYFDSTKNYALNEFIEDAKNNDFKSITSYESKDSKSSNISYLINSNYYIVPDSEVIARMVKYLLFFYDVVIIDTSAFEINKMYRTASKINANVILCIEDKEFTSRELDNSLKSINSEDIAKSLVILNKYNFMDKKYRDSIKNKYRFKIYGKIYNSSCINGYILKNRKICLKYNVNKLVRYIKVSKFEMLVLKLADKIANIESRR